MSDAFDQLLDYRAALVENFARQPAALAELARSIPEAEWRARHVAEGDTLHQVAAHLRDVETLAFLPRFRRLLMEDRPVLTPFASTDWTAEKYQPEEPLTKVLDEFARAREAAVILMRPMAPEAWARTAFHRPSGWRTTQWWVERIYRHARGHIAEIRQALSG